MKLIPGPASKELGEKIAKLSKIEAIPITCKDHPDGESYIRINGEVEKEEIIIVQTTSPPQDKRIIQLALIADAAKRHGAKKITAIIPYLAYARQDKIFLKGEPISIQAIAKMLKAAGINKIITVNIHKKETLKEFPIPAKTISAIPLLAEYFKNRGFEGAFTLAPDKGATKLAKEAQKILKGEYGYLEKHRDRYTGKIKIEKKKLNVKGKTVIIFDDIISTGGTIIKAAETLKTLGAEKIYAACVHPLLIGEAEKRILKAGVQEIIGTDSIPSKVSKVSLAPILSKELK